MISKEEVVKRIIEFDEMYDDSFDMKIQLNKQERSIIKQALSPQLDSDVDETIKELEGEYDISGFHIRNKQTHTNLINTIKQALSNQQNKIDKYEEYIKDNISYYKKDRKKAYNNGENISVYDTVLGVLYGIDKIRSEKE